MLKHIPGHATCQLGRRKGLGKEAEQHCRSYALEAERKMGELLAATERAKGTDKAGRPKIDGNRALPSNPPPTLAEIGVTKRASAEAQELAAIGLFIAWRPGFVIPAPGRPPDALRLRLASVYDWGGMSAPSWPVSSRCQ